jgi:phosphoribosylamine--glycine ligase
LPAAESLKILVIGGGGREHALVWKLAQSTKVAQIFCAPGNGGTQSEKKCTNVAIGVMNFAELKEFALEKKIDLVVVGPDNPLADGIVDMLEDAGLRVFGPTKAQSKVEWSKAHAKELMTKIGVPTPKYVVVNSHEEGKRAVKEHAWARVVKADGLALGKGVLVCQTEAEVLDGLHEIFEKKAFGTAGDTVLLEEKIAGEEISLLMLCDGQSLRILSPSQDHKRRYDDDQGPNTGGMGAYSPVALYEELEQRILQTIVQPLEQALKDGTLSFKGVLYAGLMVSNETPMVLEFNARFGDPETQAIMPLLQSDLADLLWSCTDKTLAKADLRWSNEQACCVVAVAQAYPSSSSRGEEIEISALPAGAVVFHAGTKFEGGKLITDGGRILAVVACEQTMAGAAKKCYAALNSVSFKSKDFRTDIARRAFEKCLSV